MIIIVFGLPGSGKSYFALRLAQLLSASYINSDQLRKKMVEKRTYEPEEKDWIYHLMLSIAWEACQNKTSLIIDATFSRQHHRQAFIDRLSPPCKVYFIKITAAIDVVKKRLSVPRKHSEADYAVYEKIRQEWDAFNGKHLTLQSTDDNIDEMLKKATQYLESK